MPKWSVRGATAAERKRIADALDEARTWVRSDGYRLSDRLWMGSRADRKAINNVLRRALREGMSPLQVEKLLLKYLTPGGMRGGIGNATTRDGQTRYPVGTRFDKETGTWVENMSRKGNYAARRLARTELARAYGAAQLEAAMANPWTTGVKWNLAHRHDRDDECDQNANADTEGMGPGVYSPENFPRYPNHPNCLCYITKEAAGMDAILELAKLELAAGG